MNGEDFLDALKRIGYPGADKLDGQSFDWLFDYEATLPFLKMFCKEVQSSNVIDKKDLDEYKELEKASKGSILSGEELDNALQRWSLIDSSSGTAVTDEEISKLREELSVSRQRRDDLKSLHHKLDLHHSVLVDRLARLDGLIKAEHMEYQQMVDKIQRENNSTNQVLKSVETCVSQLLSLYKSLSSSQQNEMFLSHCDMEEYHLSEEKFTQELVAFTKKQFFEGIGEIARHDEGSEYELIEVSNPDLLLIKGSSEDVILEASKDLAHLQTLYPVTEAKRIDALVKERGMAASCEFQDRLIATLKDNPYPNDHQSLSAKLKAAQASLAIANRDMVELTDVTIPSQIKTAASLQSIKVLSGDYDLKLARQDYFTANQDKVVDELTTQKSRTEFLTMALELEAKTHRDLHRLLSAITLLLQKMRTSFDARLEMMRELAKDSSRTSRTVVDSRDSFLHSLHQLISIEDESDEKQKTKSLFVTYSQIEKNAEKFSNQMASTQASLSTADQLNHESLLLLDKELTKCDSVLYAESSTTRGQPLLCPKPVVDAMDQLNSLIKKLEPAVLDIIKFIENRKKMLEKDSRLKMERALFTNFHNDPSQLRRCVHDIESRVEAHEDLKPT